MLGPSRNSKIAALLKRAIADIIQTKVKDPRIGNWVSVSDVDLSKDKSSAKVYITMLAQEQEHEQAIVALNKAASFIRSKLISKIDLRYVPYIKFYIDKSITNSQYISSLINDGSSE